MAETQAQIPTQMPMLDTLLSSGQPRKLRESCTQCASSKVKCNKVKPMCARCARRGMSCEYGISRRTGRNRAPSLMSLSSIQRPGSALPTPTKTPQPQSRSGSSGSAGGYFRHHARSVSSTKSFPDNDRRSRSPTPQGSPLNTPFTDTPLPTPTSASSIANNHHHNEQQDYWASMASDVDDLLVNLTMPDFPDVDPADLDPSALLSISQDPFADYDMSLNDPLDDGLATSTPSSSEHNVLIFEDLSSTSDGPSKSEPPSGIDNSDHVALFFEDLPSADSASFMNESHSSSSTSSISGSGVRSPATCCLGTTLALMMQLFPNAATGCTMPGNRQDGSCRVRTIESVISENKQGLESITKVLDCPCSQDEYIVAVMTLVVFKVLNWYAAVAGESSPADDTMDWNSNDSSNLVAMSSLGEQVLHLPTTIGNYCVEGENQGRMAAQLVLSELHRVQRLVSVLSQRLESIRLRNRRVDGVSGFAKGSAFGMPALSVLTFEQLEKDLRRKLKAVSSETIEMLRRT